MSLVGANSRLLVLARVVCVVLVALVACRGTADDAARIIAGQADDLARARSAADDIARTLALQAAASRAASRVDDIASDFAATTDVDEALQALMWDVGCDVLTGTIPATADGIAGWLLLRSIGFGLEFTGDAPRLVGEALLSAGFSDSGSDAAEACAQLRGTL
jgi:hypothetical protein